jgi:site-specific recombinase XerD
VREFLAYAREARPEGRFGSDRLSAKREARPATVNAYFRILRAFTNFCLEEGLLQETPLKNVKEPKIPKDQIQPFSDEQVEQLLHGARAGANPERDAAVIALLIDTGIREGEIEKLTISQAKHSSGDLEVLGKGNKRRTVHMGVKARRLLWRHIEVNRRDALPEEPLFVSTGGNTPGAALTHAGFYRIVGCDPGSWQASVESVPQRRRSWSWAPAG